jgi:hypothetical protein
MEKKTDLKKYKILTEREFYDTVFIIDCFKRSGLSHDQALKASSADNFNFDDRDSFYTKYVKYMKEHFSKLGAYLNEEV